VVIAAGGTAGHVVPALAVAGELRARGCEVHWIGGERAEAELVPAAGYPFHRIAVQGIERRSARRAARSVGLATVAVPKARGILRRVQADVVMGGGGYVAGPVGLAARTAGIPIVLTEADSHLGISNRLLARFARRVCLAFPIEGLGPPRYLLTGRPVPAGTGRVDRAAARARFRIAGDERCLLVFGGSLGARSLNLAAVEAFGRAAPCAVLHAAGRRDYPELRARLDELGAPAHYHLEEYIEPFADALACADLAAARAGGSVLELAAAGVPSILVPYPHATADHQTKNARWMADGGAAVVVPDDELDGPRLAREAAALLGAPQRLAEMRNAALALAKPDAAERIADEVMAAASA
jgi:UDP-N-acetylglucosamine--N-acetylmuramyl-(pentapeptide) pyrophosphoryl-undecaprenol N-acetylglucosamine transferase